MSWMQDKQKREKWLHFVQSLHPNIDPKAVRLMDEMRFVSRAIHLAGEQSLDVAGLSFAQYRVLMHLFFCGTYGRSGGIEPFGNKRAAGRQP